MAWIKSHQELRNHPKTSRLARFCGIPLAQAIGHLHILWWSALDYADDGDMSTLDNEEIAALSGWDGDAAVFVEALCRAGFIDESGDGYVIHDWDEYAGRLVDEREKRREQDRDRAKAYRDRQKERHATVTRDSVTRHATVQDRHGPVTHVEKSRVEESREEQSRDTPLPPASGGDAPAARGVSVLEQRFNEFWEAYPNKKSKQDALKAWGKLKPDETLFTRIMDAVQAQIDSCDWKKENGRYIPHPASWLNGGRWEDEIQGGSAHGNNEQGAGFTPKSITMDDLPGFHNALDRYCDKE